MIKIISILSILTLTGCEATQTGPTVDQCMRKDLFQQCMKLIPPGPTNVQYNDWQEVVEQCALTAYYQSLRQKEYIKPECRT